MTNSKRTRNKENIARRDTNSDGEDECLATFQANVLNKLKRGENDGQHTRRVLEQILAFHGRHEKTQKVILENQKKIKRALLKYKVSGCCWLFPFL